MAEVPEIDVHTAAQASAEGAVLIDVREDDEWAAGHAPNAIHAPLSRLGGEYADKIPEGQKVLCICKVGGRSAQATSALLGAGYDVVNVAGGMKAWETAGMPVVCDDGSPGAVI